MKQQRKHLFALYYEAIFDAMGAESKIYDIEEKAFVQRMLSILRLSVGDTCIFFDREQHALVRLMSFEKRALRVEIESIQRNRIFKPMITYLLPVLKRDAFEQAVYFLVEAGVQDIRLIFAEKMQRKWGGQKELDRLQRIVIAAAEQSKNFAFPVLKAPMLLADQLENLLRSQRYYGDPTGKPVFSIISQKAPDHVTLTTGPEGDFSSQEKLILAQHSFQPISLTPTILRAETAAFCLSSILRSVY